MRLLFITEFYPSDDRLVFTGGVEAYNFFLIRELAKSHEVTVIARKTHHACDDVLGEKIKVYRVGWKSGIIETSIFSLPIRISFVISSFLKGLTLDFDVVQGNNFTTYIQSYLVGLLKGKSTVAWYPDVFIGRWISLVGIISGLIGETSERISVMLPWSKIIALSKQTKEGLLRVGVSEKKIEVIYGGVDLNSMRRIKAEKHKVFTICCVGRLVSYKRIDLLIKAIGILDSQINCKVKIIGDGPDKSYLINLIRDFGLEKKVRIVSNLERDILIKEIKSSHLFCLPSEVEGFGLVIIEASAAGIPYVITDTPVFREITKNGLGGQFFKKGDEFDLAQKILFSYENRKNSKKKELLKLVENYSWKNIANQFQEVYLKIV